MGRVWAGSFYIGCDRIVSNITNGDTSALSELYERLKRPVFVLALSIVKDYGIAEDIMQETFLKVAVNAGSYRKGTNAQAWVFSITRNLALDFLKMRRPDSLDDNRVFESSTGFEEKIASTLEFRRMIEALDDIEKQIIALHVAGRLKHKQIAKILGISAANVRAKYSRALKKMKTDYSK